MRSSKLFLTIAVFGVAAAYAAHVDMKDPRRALGRQDDIRVDAQLTDDSVSTGSPVGVTYQIENLSPQPVAVADKVCDVSYDMDTRTITLSVGSEVPKDGTMPHLVTIGSKQKKTFTIGAILHVAAPTVRSPFTRLPKFVQVKVSFLKDVEPFRALIEKQELTDAQFDEWLDRNDTIFLNPIPVQYNSSIRNGLADASQTRSGAGTRF